MASAKKWSLEQRFPTKHARELAGRATDEFPVSAPMTEYLDTWLATYRAAGGMEKKP